MRVDVAARIGSVRIARITIQNTRVLVLDALDARTANSLAQNHAEMPPKSPRYVQNDLEAAE